MNITCAEPNAKTAVFERIERKLFCFRRLNFGFLFLGTKQQPGAELSMTMRTPTNTSHNQLMDILLRTLVRTQAWLETCVVFIFRHNEQASSFEMKGLGTLTGVA
jgi:hypothetical protein